MNSITKKVNDFYDSKWSIIIFSIVGTVFAFIEILLFAFNVININGVWENTATQEELIGTSIAVGLALFSLYYGFWVSVANTRKSSYAWFLALISMIVFLITDLMAGLWMVTIEYTFAICLIIYRRSFWAKEKYKLEQNQLKNKWWLLVLVGVIAGTIYFTLVGVWGEQIYSHGAFGMPAANKDDKWVWYLDAITATLGSMGTLAMLFRWRIAYVIWAIVSILIVPPFIKVGNYVQIFQILMWTVIDVLTVLALTHQQKDYVGKEQ